MWRGKDAGDGVALAGKMGTVDLPWLEWPFEDLLWSYFLDPVTLPSLSHHHLLADWRPGVTRPLVNGGSETWSRKSFPEPPVCSLETSL